MTEDPKSVDAERDLAAFVREQAARQSEVLLAAAHARAAEIEGEARDQAHKRVEAAKRREAARAADLWRKAEARVLGRLEGRRREIMAGRLQEARRHLATLLEDIWRSAPHRERWAREAVVRAGEIFARDGWTLALSGPEDSRLAETLHGLVPDGTAFIWSVPGRGGLSVLREGAVLDATVEGFLAQGVRLDARLLAALEDQTREGGR